MGNEEYGVELSLVIDKFKQKMQQVQGMVSQFAQKAKTDFDTGVNIDISKAKDELNKFEGDLEGLKNKMSTLQQQRNIGFNVDNSIKKTEEQIKQTQSTINSIKADIKTVSSSPFAILGKTVENAKNALKNLGKTAKENIDFKGILEKTKNKFKEMGNNIKNTVKNFNLFKKAGNSIEKSTKKLSSSLKKFALSLFGIQTAYRAVSKATQAYLSYDQELSKSIQQTWAGLGSFFAPVLEYVVSLFKQFLTYTNAVVKALTGIDFVARANAKALKNQATQACKSAKALAGFDELTNLNQQQETEQIQLANIDTTGVVAVFEQLKEMFMSGDFAGIATLFSEKLIEGLTTVSQIISNLDISGFTNAINGLFINIDYSGILVGLVEVFGEAVLKLQELLLGINFPVILGNLSTGIADAIFKIGDYVGQIDFSALGTLLGETFTSIDWLGIGNSILNLLWQGLMGIVDLFLGIDWGKVGKTISDAVRGWIQTIIQKFKETDWQQLGKDIGDAIINFLISIDWLGVARDILDGLAYGILAGIQLIVGAFESIFEAILNFFGIHSPSTKFKEVGINIIEGLKNGILELKDSVVKIFQDIWSGIKSVFSSVGTFFKNTFTNAWTAVKNVFSTGGKIFDGIKDGIVNAFKSIVNKLIDGINKVVATPFNKINEMLNTIRNTDILGVKPFKGLWKQNPIGVPKIPKLSIGTDDVRSEGLAYLHAGEKVVPADVAKGGYTGGDNEETNSLLRQLIQVLEDKDFEPTITVDEIGKASVRYITNKNRVMGGSII